MSPAMTLKNPTTHRTKNTAKTGQKDLIMYLERNARGLGEQGSRGALIKIKSGLGRGHARRPRVCEMSHC